MMESKMYQYIKNQYLLGAFKDADLDVLVSRGHITETEKNQILALKA